MASALWLIVCLVPLIHSQILPNTFNMQPSISPIGISSNTDNVVSLNNNNNNPATTTSSSNSSDVPIDLSQLLLKLIRLAKDLAHDRPPFDPRPRSFPDTVDNSLISSDTSGDSSLWSPVALIIDSGSSDSTTDAADQPQAAAQAFNIVYGVDSGNQAANPANPFPTLTATQQQPGSFAQSSSPFAMPFASSLSQTMQPSGPFATSFAMNQQQQQQPFFTTSNSLMPMPAQDDSLPLTFNSQPSYGYGQWPHFGRWMHPWGHGGPFSWMNYLQSNTASDDQQDDDNNNNNVDPAYAFFKSQGEDKNVDSDEMIKPEDFEWRPKWQPRFGMDRDLLGPRMHGRSDEGRHGGFGHLGEQRWPMKHGDDDDDEGSVDEKRDWKGPEGGSSSEEQDGDERVGPQDDSMDRGHGGRGGRGRRGKGKDCMCKKVTRILDEMKRKHRGGRRAMFDDN